MPRGWLHLLLQKRKRKIKRKKRASSSNSELEGGYDIFLSFRGEDTRMKFTDHLYEALERAGFNTFRDEEKINKGKTIKSELRKGIRNSKMSVVVLSENYASSKSCLFELRTILKRRKKSGHYVLPVFYEVEPHEIKKQAEKLDFRKMKAKVEKVNKWSAALKKVAGINGVVFGNQSNRYEAKCIRKIVGILKSKKAGKHPRVGNHLVPMAPNILPLKDINLNSKNYTIHAIVLEKNMPKTSTKSSSQYQRLVLQDIELYHTYSITNAAVTTTLEQFRFLEQKCQLTISARSPVEAKKIDGLTQRSIKFNFTPLADIGQIKDPDPNLDILFAVLEVGPCKPANHSRVTDVLVVDQSLQPTIISLWDQFSDYKAPAMASLRATFPVAIGHRLKTSSYYSMTLATKITSGFTFNSQIPEALELQSWCVVNADKIKQLPPLAAMYTLLAKSATTPSSDSINIIDLPSTVDKVQLINVKGIARVTNFNQRFHYLSCSICNKASIAYENSELWCNYCARRVPALARVKFTITITDPTATIDATVFPEVAEEIYSITGANIAIDTPDQPLSPEFLDKLAEPKRCNITLKVYMYSYAGIAQCRFNVHSMTNEPPG
ncbi:hypothetical protein RHGRI_026006 [Rhododendron griersonianum]|uniref:TIR domain-containing protein n=1 Tax=Rhododendron griersonianum TaxID=479676 RepID=A0AAV6IR40_9ERIC|nr:hypothetical protein RHGRI_026006 [Rhododendron griersonianum]